MIASSPAVGQKLITGEELLAMGDIESTELIDGRIVYLSPTSGGHGYEELEVGALLRSFVRPRKLGWVLTGEVGIYVRRNPDRIRAADVAFVSRQRMSTRPKQGFLTIAPELVVEIVSPGDLWEDLQQKIEDYFSIGVERLWIVEPDKKDVLVYRSTTDLAQVRTGETLRGEGILDGFQLSVAELFED